MLPLCLCGLLRYRSAMIHQSISVQTLVDKFSNLSLKCERRRSSNTRLLEVWLLICFFFLPRQLNESMITRLTAKHATSAALFVSKNSHVWTIKDVRYTVWGYDMTTQHIIRLINVTHCFWLIKRRQKRHCFRISKGALKAIIVSFFFFWCFYKYSD